MKANAWHHRADAISSVVALVGVGKSFLKNAFHFTRRQVTVMLLEYEG
jgi:divalent metal cation (Fe/Co/Zn/Cd) transporter